MKPDVDASASHAQDGAAAALALRARRGDRVAFEALYRHFAPSVSAVLIAHVGTTLAQDLVQEVFLTALRTIDTLEQPGRVGAWLCSIARNRARDVLRSPARDTGALAESELAAPERDPAAAQEAEEILAVVRGLPEAYRETLCLRLVEGLSGPEIAERTGLTHGSVRVNLCRGMKLLRERLAEGGWS